MERGSATMPISKLGQRRQVVIPKDICEALGLEIGDFVEVRQVKGSVVIKPKKLVDADEVLAPSQKAEIDVRLFRITLANAIRPERLDGRTIIQLTPYTI